MRLLALAGLAGSVLLGVGLASAAIIGPDGTVKGCVKSGTIRVIDQDESCKSSEVPVTFLTGSLEITTAMIKDGEVKSADIGDGEVGSDDLSAAFKDSLMTTGSTVPWSQLSGVPAGLGDGDDVDGGTASDLDCVGCLTATDLGDDSVGFDEIAAGAVRGESTPAGGTPTGSIALKSIAGANMADDAIEGGLGGVIKDGTVSASDLASGAVGPNQIQSGAVGTEKQTANGAVGSGGGGTLTLTPTTSSDEATAVSTVLTPAGSGSADHLVLLTGQFQAGSYTGTETITVTWQIMDGATPVGPAYSTILSTSQSTASGSVTFLDSTALENVSKTYSLRVSASGTVTSDRTIQVSSPSLTAVDLGRK